MHIFHIIKWIICGILITCLVNVAYIFSLYVECNDSCFYVVTVVVAVVVFEMVRENHFKNLLFAFLTMIFSNIICEMIFTLSGLTNYFYFKVNPKAIEIALGEGVLLIYIHILSGVGLIIGILASFVRMMLVNNKRT